MTIATTHDGYPSTWADFIGQDLAKRQLMVACASAKKRRKPLDHVLLAAGSPGVGKTALALLVAKACGGKIAMVSGKITRDQIRMLFATLEDGSIIFIDEIHLVGKAEWLLHVMQDGMLMGPLGPEKIPAVTIIGATTDAGRLPEPILQRFTLRPTLVPYTDAESAKIAGKLAGKVMVGLPIPTRKVLVGIATAANNNPRTMRSILVNLRDLAITGRRPTDGNYDLAEALTFAGVTPDGLTAQAVVYLKIMHTEFNGTAGQTTIAERLQEPGGLGYTERLLMDAGLLAKTGRGRVLTQAGIRRSLELELAA